MKGASALAAWVPAARLLPQAVWRELNVRAPSLPAVRHLVPPIPEEALQLRFTGKAGADTLRDGFRTYEIVKAYAERQLGSLGAVGRVLDFGCGWGRIIRFFAREVPRARLVGIDCSPEVIGFCQRTNRWATFHAVPPEPPTALEPGSFGLVYAYSVFSHLSEPAHRAWVDEFHRLLRPGGLLVVTTRPRSFIEWLHTLRTTTNPPWLPKAFTDPAAWLARYDAGEYCFDATGGDGVLDASFFGETCIPRRYVERAWQDGWELVDYLDDRARSEQAVIVARRRP